MDCTSNHTATRLRSLAAQPRDFLMSHYRKFKLRRKQERQRHTKQQIEKLTHQIDGVLQSFKNDASSGSSLIRSTSDEDKSKSDTENECVACLAAPSAIETHPCRHRVLCRVCFIKTIQHALKTRALPLRCVVCRARVLKLRTSDSKRCRFSQFLFNSGHGTKPKLSRTGSDEETRVTLESKEPSDLRSFDLKLKSVGGDSSDRVHKLWTSHDTLKNE